MSSQHSVSEKDKSNTDDPQRTTPTSSNNDETAISMMICQLVSFLIANIVKTEKEWNDWGKPFLNLIFASQFPNDPPDNERVQSLAEDFQAQFFPLIGHGISLWIEESIHSQQPHNSQSHQGLEDYVFITTLEEKLSKMISSYLLFSSKQIENYLIHFFNNFYLFLEKRNNNNNNNNGDESSTATVNNHNYYDSRERDIIRKVGQLLNMSAHQFSDLEREYQTNPKNPGSPNYPNDPSNSSPFPDEDLPDGIKQYPKEDEGSGHSDLFLTLFRQHSKAIPRESLLVSYRMWRVAFIAAGGGAMVGLAGFIAAPSIVSTVIPILCNAATFTQLSVTLDTFISYVGILTYPLLPSIFTTYGATVAGTVMMKRTAAIKEFELLPLHMHNDSENQNQNKNGNKNGNKNKKQMASLYAEKDKTGLPIFILVNGHVEKSVDARVMWGANGTDLVISEQTILIAKTQTTTDKESDKESVKVEEIVFAKEVYSNEDGYHHASNPGIVSSTIKELQEELLLEESKLIAETIVQTIQNISSQQRHENRSMSTKSYDHIKDDEEEKDKDDKQEKEEDKVEEEKELHEWEELDYSYSTGWWKEIIPYGEEYILFWENDLLSHLNETFLSMIKHKLSSKIIHYLKDFFYQQITPLHAIQKSIGLPNLALAKIKQLDDCWIIAMDRALQGGKLLAHILLKQYLGPQNKKGAGLLRPVTLVGYGMGGRLIYHCLETLIQESEKYGGIESVKGIIENVVIIGTPVKIDIHTFQSFRTIIASRFINCYSRYDWILALLYRSKAYELLIAGLYPIYLPGQAHEPTRIANQREQLFIERIETRNDDKDSSSMLSLSMSVMTPESIEKKEEEEGARLLLLLAEKEKEVKARLRQVTQESKIMENYDVTDLVYLQTDYPKVLPAIMKLINLQQT